MASRRRGGGRGPAALAAPAAAAALLLFLLTAAGAHAARVAGAGENVAHDIGRRPEGGSGAAPQAPAEASAGAGERRGAGETLAAERDRVSALPGYGRLGFPMYSGARARARVL